MGVGRYSAYIAKAGVVGVARRIVPRSHRHARNTARFSFFDDARCGFSRVMRAAASSRYARHRLLAERFIT